eukprot:TRINITY_DN6520_c0_g2_i1.p2 TRINITY_DN6520_c0_g2~~TRINITY_DN6520_c0_g2_i1.p2  ORF type:complete len:104 (-),score=3.82 TRINITY_DN6520_c0_g2_i1:211-522(-)
MRLSFVLTCFYIADKWFYYTFAVNDAGKKQQGLLTTASPSLYIRRIHPIPSLTIPPTHFFAQLHPLAGASRSALEDRLGPRCENHLRYCLRPKRTLDVLWFLL